MIILALVFVFIPFFSLPPFIYSSYVQPFTLFVGWTILLYTLSLRLSENILIYLSLFIIYILFLKLGVYGSGFIPGDVSNLFAYFVAFFQISLFISLFRRVFSRCVRGDLSLFSRVQKAFDFSILVVALSVPLQLVGPVNQFLTFIKPRTVELSELGLAKSLRGLSGVMPEPSYLGTCLAILLLSSFLFGYFRFVCIKNNSLSYNVHYLPLGGILDVRHYSMYIKYFLQTYFSYILLSLFSIFLAFSPTSVVTFFCIVCLSIIPFLVHAFSGFLRRDFLFYCFIILLLLLAFLFFSVNLFAQSRLSSLLTLILSQGLSGLESSDQSIADRYSSVVLGIFSIFSYPFGLGLNGHGYIMSDCSNELVKNFELMCGNIFTSSRNHNAFSNILIDGGFISCLWISLLLYDVARLQLFLRTSLKFSLKISFLLFPIVILFAFVLLPAPLGSPFLWLPFSISISFMRELPGIFEDSTGQIAID